MKNSRKWKTVSRSAIPFYNAGLEEYRRGVKNGADLKNAEVTLLEAKYRPLELRYQFHDIRIKLEKALGISVETRLEH